MARTHTRQTPHVGDLRTRTIPAVPEHLPIGAARKVATLKQVAALFVERDGRLVGVLDERALASGAEDAEVASLMTAIESCLHPAMSMGRAREVFMQSRVSILPVTFGALLLGALARPDIERALAKPCPAPRRRVARFRAAA
jgi:CBS domain-containing protein